MKVLVTGGCGFIGSNFIRYLLTNPEARKLAGENIDVTNLDKRTYAARGENLEHMGITSSSNYHEVKGDICDQKLVQEVFQGLKPEMAFNFAAESHVDNSWKDSAPFLRTNVLGTGVLLETARFIGPDLGLDRFVQISTDEVYGSAPEGKSFTEEDIPNPQNPYSKSKRGAEVLAAHYGQLLGVPVVITRSSNNYGPYQHPEKLLPKFITNLILGKKVPLMWSQENPGLNVRDWLHVEDNCRAIWHLANLKESFGVYNIPGDNERTNIDMTKILLRHFGRDEEMIDKVQHRPQHDFRYSIDGRKLMKTGFKYVYRKDLDAEVHKLCKWYEKNQNWWEKLTEK